MKIDVPVGEGGVEMMSSNLKKGNEWNISLEKFAQLSISLELNESIQSWAPELIVGQISMFVPWLFLYIFKALSNYKLTID